MSESSSNLIDGYPYESHFEELVEILSSYETRIHPEDSAEAERFELDYGWQAILYEEESGLLSRISKKLTDINAGSTNYRSRPEHKWELRAPDGETYRLRGIDISQDEFSELIEDIGF